jgi:hypothetical protein
MYFYLNLRYINQIITVKKLLLFTLTLIVAADLLAQNDTTLNYSSSQRDRRAAKRDRINNLMKMEEEGDIIFNKHNVFGLRLATDGYGIFFEKGKYKSNTRTLLYQFELNEKKDGKDHKVAAAGYNGYDFNSVIVGKLNNFYQFKLAIGQQHLIGGKGNKNGVAITGLYSGGLSLGILKPYYVDVQDLNGNQFRSKYPDIIDSGYTELGASGFTVGWDHVKFKPGLNAKTAIRFDYGRFNETITAIEVGLTGEYYLSKVPMMYLVPERNFFFNAYLAIMFGKRK